jgi:hypothetical protein
MRDLPRVPRKSSKVLHGPADAPQRPATNHDATSTPSPWRPIILLCDDTWHQRSTITRHRCLKYITVNRQPSTHVLGAVVKAVCILDVTHPFLQQRSTN